MICCLSGLLAFSSYVVTIMCSMIVFFCYKEAGPDSVLLNICSNLSTILLDVA
jgi:hypothetical protein